MDTSYIISNMNAFMFQLRDRIGSWLERQLPNITKNWWNDLVVSYLTPLQREAVRGNDTHALRGLDLAALLRVLDKNWIVISNKIFINKKYRKQLHQMQEIRNRWAHITPADISKQIVIDDADVIRDLMEAFGAQMKDTQPLEQFILAVKEDKEIGETVSNEPLHRVPMTAQLQERSTAGGITKGSVVTLVSDTDAVGAVTEIDGNQYKVFMNGRIQTYYKEQIRLQEERRSCIYCPPDRIRTALTAYQIHHPGTSNLYSLNAARIDFVPYQFRPALRMIQGDSPRILIADDVGVGKTIEAGLILKELEARSGVSSVLIICPRPLVAERKWQLEMKRFDEDFTQLDSGALAECISETDRDGEGPERHAKTIIPYSLFGENSIGGRGASLGKGHKRRGLLDLDPVPHFDLVIVDEAHTIRNPNTWAYRGVELFCRNADAVVFLTATPLQNSNKDLYTLLNLLRPDVVVDQNTFRVMSEPNVYVNKLLCLIRNQPDGWHAAAKEALEQILHTDWGRNVVRNNPAFEKIEKVLSLPDLPRDERIMLIRRVEELHSFHTMISRTRRKDIEDFCIRRTQTVEVPFHPVQKELYERLIQFESAALERLHGNVNVRFMMCTIMRQASSCLHALAPFIDDLIARRFSQIQEEGTWDDFGVEIGDGAKDSLHELAGEIRALLIQLPEDDPKFNRLLEILQEKQATENNRVILFSTFRHTLSYLRRKLTVQGLRVGQADGSVGDEERYRLRERFQMERSDPEAIDVLLFSEIGCEGLDYQFCDTMINYDLPWNPMRIEQRIGRIDRRGQQSDTVKIYNMIISDTIDAVIYNRCLSKIGVFEESIGDCSEILGDISDQITKIMFNAELTEEERRQKIEQMADNETMKIQEMRRLEQEEKALFGFDLSQYMTNKDVQDAENTWLSAGQLNDLVIAYMNDRLGTGEYILGRQEGKILRLGADKRKVLFDDFMKMPSYGNNHAAKLWKAYLKSDRPILSITFESTYAKDHRDATFLTQMHPLLVQAAVYESRDFPLNAAFRIADAEIPPGDYAFLIYAWRYTGIRPDIQLVAVSDEPGVEQNILSYISYAAEYDVQSADHNAEWSAMEKLHYGRWQTAQKAYVDEMQTECSYRKDQLGQSYRQQENVLLGQIESASNDLIRRMKGGQLENMKRKYGEQLAKLDASTAKADIHMNLLLRGILHVEAVATEEHHGKD